MIFLTGPHGAGKSKTAGILVTFGFLAIDLGPALRRIHLASRSPLSFEGWLKAGEEKSGTHFTDDLLAFEVLRLKNVIEGSYAYQDVVITGSRSATGVRYICSQVPSVNGNRNSVIFIDAPLATLRTRYNKREGLDLNREEFIALLSADEKLGLKTIRPMADFHIWNQGSEGELRANIENIIFHELKYVKP